MSEQHNLESGITGTVLVPPPGATLVQSTPGTGYDIPGRAATPRAPSLETAICPSPPAREPADPIAENVHLQPAVHGDGLIRRDVLGDPDQFLDPLCAVLRDLQRRRRFLIRSQSRLDRSIESFIALRLGSGGLPAGECKKIYARAAMLMSIVALDDAAVPAPDNPLEGDAASKDLVKVAAARKKAAAARKIAAESAAALRRGLSHEESLILAEEHEIIRISLVQRKPVDDLRRMTECAMVEVAHTLPVWPFVEGVRGVSALGLAVIIGEAGDPTAYRDKHTLCKRLGLGVVDGVRQGSPGEDATPEDWVRHGDVKRRRAEMFAFLYDVMIRAQWRAEKDDVPAHALGPYGEIYGRQKTVYLGRGLLAGHADKAARRYAAKAFIRDLRSAWRAAA